MSKYTPWFPGSVKPRRKGVYQQISGSGHAVGYQFWNGKHWGCWGETPDIAVTEARWKACTQDDEWRGLAKRPR